MFPHKHKIFLLTSSLCLSAHGASVIANSDFEAFSITGAGYNAVNSTTNPNGWVNDFGPTVKIYPQTVAGMGWQTTDSQGRIEIWASSPGVPSSPVGGQFAELNAFENSALFQDVEITLPGLVDYSFSHRGRNGPDTAKVLITYLGANNTIGGGDDVVVVNTNFTTGNNAWGEYAVDNAFISVAGGFYRFSFGAVSSTPPLVNGQPGPPNITEGNFLDNIKFGVDAVPEPSAALLGSLGLLALLRRNRR